MSNIKRFTPLRTTMQSAFKNNSSKALRSFNFVQSQSAVDSLIAEYKFTDLHGEMLHGANRFSSLCKITFICGLIAVNCVNEVKSVEFYAEKPAFLPSCKIYQPGFTKCSTNSVQKLIDQLIIGIPEVVQEFGPFDPMHVHDIYFKQDGNDVARLYANLSDVIVKGFSKTIIKESRVSKKDFNWITKIFLPKMRMDAVYKMEGRILLIPLRGSGKMFIEIDNLDITLYTKTRLYEKAGFTFDNVTSVRVDLNMTSVRTNFENIFNGHSKEVERSTNEFFNENWREFYEALKPIITETVETILYGVMHKVFNLIPANFFVEDIPTSQQLYGTNKS